jgi:hypothetical protein
MLASLPSIVQTQTQTALPPDIDPVTLSPWVTPDYLDEEGKKLLAETGGQARKDLDHAPDELHDHPDMADAVGIWTSRNGFDDFRSSPGDPSIGTAGPNGIRRRSTHRVEKCASSPICGWSTSKWMRSIVSAGWVNSP